LDFPVQEAIESMDRLAIIHGQKIVKQRLDFSVKGKIEAMDGLAIIKGQKNC